MDFTDFTDFIIDYELPITDYRLPITDYRLPITDYQLTTIIFVLLYLWQ
jgi:hypothetical protein